MNFLRLLAALAVLWVVCGTTNLVILRACGHRNRDGEELWSMLGPMATLFLAINMLFVWLPGWLVDSFVKFVELAGPAIADAFVLDFFGKSTN